MRKNYKEATVIGSSEVEQFQSMLAEKVDGFQKDGYHVEIQYQTHGLGDTTVFSALILAYEKELFWKRRKG